MTEQEELESWEHQENVRVKLIELTVDFSAQRLQALVDLLAIFVLTGVGSVLARSIIIQMMENRDNSAQAPMIAIELLIAVSVFFIGSDLYTCGKKAQNIQQQIIELESQISQNDQV